MTYLVDSGTDGHDEFAGYSSWYLDEACDLEYLTSKADGSTYVLTNCILEDHALPQILASCSSNCGPESMRARQQPRPIRSRVGLGSILEKLSSTIRLFAYLHQKLPG